jgi:hypothetical protein
MLRSPRIPPYRSLDIYRLVVVRGLKQLDVAKSFGLTPARVSQIVRRVREWVNAAVADWLFPGRDDLRFYAALQCEQIRPVESEQDPETVLFCGTNRSYSRRDRAVNQVDDWRPGSSELNTLKPDAELKSALNLSAQPGNSEAVATPAPNDATPCNQTASDSIATTELAHRLGQLLILWKKSQKLERARNTA